MNRASRFQPLKYLFAPRRSADLTEFIVSKKWSTHRNWNSNSNRYYFHFDFVFSFMNTSICFYLFFCFVLHFNQISIIFLFVLLALEIFFIYCKLIRIINCKWRERDNLPIRYLANMQLVEYLNNLLFVDEAEEDEKGGESGSEKKLKRSIACEAMSFASIRAMMCFTFSAPFSWWLITYLDASNTKMKRAGALHKNTFRMFYKFHLLFRFTFYLAHRRKRFKRWNCMSYQTVYCTFITQYITIPILL